MADVIGAEFQRVTLVVEQNESAGPEAIGLLSTTAEVLNSAGGVESV